MGARAHTKRQNRWVSNVKSLVGFLLLFLLLDFERHLIDDGIGAQKPAVRHSADEHVARLCGFRDDVLGVSVRTEEGLPNGRPREVV
jgi:hypothetical protein